MNNTPQGGTIEDNAADDILMVDQGLAFPFISCPVLCYNLTFIRHGFSSKGC